jgi:hypothetical protein
VVITECEKVLKSVLLLFWTESESVLIMKCATVAIVV